MESPDLEFIASKVRQYQNGDTPLERELYAHWIQEYQAAVVGAYADQFIFRKMMQAKQG